MLFKIDLLVYKPLLGRWNLKSCNEISTSIKTGIIAVTPKKASGYKYLKESHDSKVNAPVYETTDPN